MAKNAVTLPEGFVLEEQPQLPEGFVLEEQPSGGLLNKFKDMMQNEGGKLANTFSDLHAAGTLNVPGIAAGAIRRGIEDPVKTLETAPIAGATAGGMIGSPLVGGMIGGAAGKLVEAAGKKLLGSEATTTPKNPFTGKELPKVPKLPKLASDMIVEAGIQGAFTVPGVIMKAAEPTLDAISKGFATRALGLTKRFQNTGRKLDDAEQAAMVMLEEGIVKSVGAKTMYDRVKAMKSTVGTKIGDFLERNGKRFDVQKAIAELDALKPRSKEGKLLIGGKYKKDIEKIDEAIETLNSHAEEVSRLKFTPGTKTLEMAKGLSYPNISFEDANAIKSRLQEDAVFGSVSTNKELDRKIAGVFRAGVDEQLEAISGNGPEFKNFLENKRIYKAAALAEDGLVNRLSSQRGNNLGSLSDWIFGGVATGGALLANPGSLPFVLAGIGVKKVAENYGVQSAASFARKIERSDKAAWASAMRLGVNAIKKIYASEQAK